MVAAAMPKRTPSGRQSENPGTKGMGKSQGSGMYNPMLGKREQHNEPEPTQRWNSKAWDAYEYRANVPTLVQFDRDRRTRGHPKERTQRSSKSPELIRPKSAGILNPRRRNEHPSPRRSRNWKTEVQKDHGSNDNCSQPEEVKDPETVPLKALGEKVKDTGWVHRIKKKFVKKFYAASTLATKNTKRKKVLEILEGVSSPAFPLTTESITTVAAVLDSTGMKAGDQYLAEAKSMHVEEGFEWSMCLDRQMSTCKRAMQRDKGPENRAKEVRAKDIKEEVWAAVNTRDKEPRRVAWSYAWATIWMFRAIEAAQISAKDVIVKLEERVVKHFIPKSKTDQRCLGTWRTLKCCGRPSCDRLCPFSLAVDALNDMKCNDGKAPLFPDEKGNRVSKVHMVTAWANALDPEMSGHSARRSGSYGLCESWSECALYPVLGQMEVICSFQIHRRGNDGSPRST